MHYNQTKGRYWYRKKEQKGEEDMTETVHFGDVMMIHFRGHNRVQDKIRPGVIIQNDIGNKNSPTSIAIPLTKVLKKEKMPCHKILYKNEQNGLSSDSMMLGEQVRVIDKEGDILYKMGTLNDLEIELALEAYFANVPKRRKKKYE